MQSVARSFMYNHQAPVDNKANTSRGRLPDAPSYTTDRDDENKSQRTEDCGWNDETKGALERKLLPSILHSPLSPDCNPNENLTPTRNWVDGVDIKDQAEDALANIKMETTTVVNVHDFEVWKPTNGGITGFPSVVVGSGVFASIISPVKVSNNKIPYYGPTRHIAPCRQALKIVGTPLRGAAKMSEITETPTRAAMILSPAKGEPVLSPERSPARLTIDLNTFKSPSRKVVMSPIRKTTVLTTELAAFRSPVRKGGLSAELAAFRSPVRKGGLSPQQQFQMMTPSMMENIYAALRTPLQNMSYVDETDLFSPGLGAMIGRVSQLGGGEFPNLQSAQVSMTPERRSFGKVPPVAIFEDCKEERKLDLEVHPGGGYVKVAKARKEDSVTVTKGYESKQFPRRLSFGKKLNNVKNTIQKTERTDAINESMKNLWIAGTSSRSLSPIQPEEVTANEKRAAVDPRMVHPPSDHQTIMETIHRQDESAFVRMVKDARGSRLVQDALDNSSEVDRHRMFDKLVKHAHQLCVDQFGHYVIQKFFALGNDYQRRQLIQQLKGKFVSLAKHNIGCRVMQRAAPHVCKADFLAVVDELAACPAEMARDTSASHVVQKLLERFVPLVVTRLMPGMKGKFVSLCKESFSCRIVQRLLELRDESVRKTILKEVMSAVYPLSKQEFGNYIIQHVIKHFDNGVVKKVYRQLQPHLAELATNKFSSNVLEHLYTKGGCSEVQGALVRAAAKDSVFLDTCVRDKYGNYFLQTILQSSITAHSRQLAHVLRERYGKGLEEMQYGKYIAMKLAKLNISPEPRNKGGKHQKRRSSLSKKDDKGRRGW